MVKIEPATGESRMIYQGMVKVSTDNAIHYFEGGEEVYPCRCGETHRGDYAAYDYAHHNCFHDEFMMLELETPQQIVCLYCGKVAALTPEQPSS
jgi:hypothetical protein